MATIKDVAKKAGVSVATVSAVINEKGIVRPVTARKVQAAIRELNYRPNRLARALSNNQSRIIGMLVPSIDNPFFPEIVKSVEDVFFQNNYSALIGSTEGSVERAAHYVQTMLEGWAQGIIISLTWETIQDEILNKLRGSSVPVVGLAGARIIPDIDCVVPDDLMGTRQAISHLIELGHRKIGFIGVQDSQTTALRLEGYRATLAEHSIPVTDDLVVLAPSFASEDGRIAARTLLERQPRPTAIFCFNDVMALGVLTAARERGLQVPRQISVLGFDDTTNDFAFPSLTSISLPKREMGRLAATMLIERIGGTNQAPRLIKVEPQLQLRNSTAPPTQCQN